MARLLYSQVFQVAPAGAELHAYMWEAEVTPFVNYHTSKWFLIIGSVDYLESICWGSILFMLVWMLCPDHKEKIFLLEPVQLRALTW